MATLTKQIKDLNEKNYQLELELRSRNSEMEKKAIKDQHDEVKKLEQHLREHKERLITLDMQKSDMQDKMQTEVVKL